MADELKQCTACCVNKLHGEFYRHPLGRDGLMRQCKVCHRQEVTANRTLKRTYYNEQRRVSYQSRKAAMGVCG